MHARRHLLHASALAAVLAFGPPAGADGIDFIVSQSGGDGGRLMLSKPQQVAEPYRILPGSVARLAGYYLAIEPGWDGLGVDEPTNGRFALAAEARIALRRVRFDPGFVMFNLDLEPVLEADGDTETLEGEPELEEFLWHEHLVFGVEPDQPFGKQFSATLVLTDLSGTYGDSEEFTLDFVTARTPATSGGGTRSAGGLCGAMGPAVYLMLASLIGAKALHAGRSSRLT